MMPAGCSYDFEWNLLPQSPAVTREVNVSLAEELIVQESTRGLTYHIYGSDKVPMTPTTPMTQQKDPDQECPLTKTMLFWSPNTFLAKQVH